MASWAELLTEAEPGGHLVHLYGVDDRLLSRNASRYLAEGLRRGDGLVVIADPEHTGAIARHLVEEEPGHAREATRAGRLVYLDAGATLARLLVAGRPDEHRFRSVIGSAIEAASARSTTGAVRAFGEMVGLLWAERKYENAERLEALWDALLTQYHCSLLCAYPIDLLDFDGDPAMLYRIVSSHDHIFAGSGTLLSSGRHHA